MDAYFDIVSLRTVREYTDQPIARDDLVKILEAARATGSSRNTQLWQFYCITNRAMLNALGETMFAPQNLRGCQAAIAIVMTTSRAFDAGRCCQNIMLSARSLGVGSSPNGIKDQDAAKKVLDLSEEEQTIPIVVSLGYPAHPIRMVGEVVGVLRRIDRKPFDDVVVWMD